ncbi:disks large-associated protein 3 isoform 4-T4 [Leptodactylus fuscus]|uniref:disks large-associated protein 3 isoform X4 n=1 Tax=Leptodactylus fuscus TaxID=238119 RepID=UPI003F4E7114
MKGYHGEGSQSQPPCHCIPQTRERALDFPHHGPDFRKSYPRSASESCSLDLHYCPSRSAGVTPDCPGGPVSMPEPRSSSGGTYPRMHHNPQQFDCDECMAAIAHTSSKINRLPPTLLDQFEKQLPLHHDGFHTLQYQRTSTTEQRSESPSRIRHLVHSVQKLFAKSHSLETPSKREYNGTRYEGRGGEGYQHSQPRHSKRSKSKDRKSEPKHRSKMAGWWSSDDNLDSDSSFLVSARHAMEHGAPFGVDTPESAFRDLTLKSLKGGGGEGKCLACAGMSMSLDGQTLKRSTWHTMTVSQAREAYPSSGSHHQDKMLMLQEGKGKERGYHYLQVPPDEWGGYPAPGKEGEIPCRRMRSGSYIKAMGDDDSGDSDTSTKMSPKGATRREKYRRSSSVDHPRNKFPCKRYSDSCLCNCPSCCTPPKIHPKGHGYGLSITGQYHNRHEGLFYPGITQGPGSPRFRIQRNLKSQEQYLVKGELNHQSGATCESVFSEVESHAVEALDLPGCFRMRSHSYLRAIQAGCSQDDDCISVFSMSGPSGPTLASSILKPNTSSSLPNQRSPMRSALSPPQRSGTLVTYSTTSVEGDTEDQELESRRCQGMIINPYLEHWSPTKEEVRVSLTVGRQIKQSFRRVSPGPLASSTEDPLCYLSAHTGWGDESDSDIPPSDRVPESAESTQSERDGGSQQTEIGSLPGGMVWPLMQEHRKDNNGEEDHQLASSQRSEHSCNESLLSSEYPEGDQASSATMPRRLGRPRAKDDRRARWRASLHRLLQLEKLRDQLYRQELALKEEEMTRQREERARDRELHRQLLGVLGDIRDELRKRRQERAIAQEGQGPEGRGTPCSGTATTTRRARGGLTRPRGTRISSVSATLPCSFAQFFLQDPRTGSSMPSTMARGSSENPTWAGSRLIGPLRRRGQPRGRPRVHPKPVMGDTHG